MRAFVLLKCLSTRRLALPHLGGADVNKEPGSRRGGAGSLRRTLGEYVVEVPGMLPDDVREQILRELGPEGLEMMLESLGKPVSDGPARRLCDFEDLFAIDESSLAQVLRLTDIPDLGLVLTSISAEQAERIYQGLPPDEARALRSTVASFPPPPREPVQAARMQMRNILRGLVALGRIRFE